MCVYQCLCLFGFLLVLQGFATINNITLVIKKIPTFPFPIGKTFDIIIGAKEKDGLLTDSILDTLAIEIRKPFGKGRQIAAMDFGFKNINDHELNGEFMKVLFWNVSEDNKLSVALEFSSLAHNKVLEIYHLNVFSTAERRIKLKDLKLATNIYRSNITLHAPPMIEIMVNSAVDAPFAFAMGSTVDAVCRVNDTSNAHPRFHKIRNMKALRNSRTEKEAQLQFVAIKAVHQKNLTCQVGNENKSVNIQVFHGPTKVTFKPDVTDVVRNGTGITCVAADGFPTPRISWHFIEGPQNASKFYTISHYNQTLFLSGKAPIGSNWKFNCSSMNNVLGTEQVYHKNLSFTVIDQLHHNSKGISTHKQWSISENCENYLLFSEMKRTTRNHSENIMKTLDLRYDKVINEIAKWFPELSKIKNIMELLRDQVKDQNIEIKKLRKIMDKDSKTGSNKVVSTTKSPRKSTTAVRKPVETLQWKVDNFRQFGVGRVISRKQSKKLGYNFDLWLAPNDQYIVFIALHMSPMDDASITPKDVETAKITIYNAENVNFYYSIQLKMKKIQKKILYREFLFRYQDIVQAKVLQSDKVVIECVIEIPPG